MRLLIAVELTGCCSSEPLPATLNNRSDAPLPTVTYPLATLVAQLLEPYLRLPQTRAQRRCAQDEVSGDYAATSSLSLPKRPTLDRSV